MIKADDSLTEVWEWKKRLYADFLRSGYSDITDFIKDETRELIKNNNIKFHFAKKENQLTSV